MAEPKHVIVVGAGLAGLTTAFYLQREGVRVTVLDRAGGPGMETSFANAALLHPSLVEPWNSPGIFWQMLKWLGREDAPMLLRLKALPGLVGWGLQFIRSSSTKRFRSNTAKNLRLAIFSLKLMRQLRDQNSIAYDYQPRGLLAVFRSPAARDAALRSAALLGSSGLKFRDLDRDALLDLEPTLGPVGDQLAGGIHYTDDEGGDAHRFCAELARLVVERGGELRYGVRVEAVVRSERRVAHVLCNGQPLTASAYVLAAGSFTPLLARQVGVRVPVRPAKGYSITMPRSLAPEAAPRIAILDTHLHAVVAPVGEARIRVAGTAELAGYDMSINPRRIENLRRLLQQMFPEFARHVGDDELSPWTGLRPMSADGVPILGATPLQNLFLNTGQGHLGWTLAAGSARLVADAVLGRTPELAIADYSLRP